MRILVYAKKARAMCENFVNMGFPVKTQMENRMDKIFEI